MLYLQCFMPQVGELGSKCSDTGFWFKESWWHPPRCQCSRCSRRSAPRNESRPDPPRQIEQPRGQRAMTQWDGTAAHSSQSGQDIGSRGHQQQASTNGPPSSYPQPPPGLFPASSQPAQPGHAAPSYGYQQSYSSTSGFPGHTHHPSAVYQQNFSRGSGRGYTGVQNTQPFAPTGVGRGNIGHHNNGQVTYAAPGPYGRGHPIHGHRGRGTQAPGVYGSSNYGAGGLQGPSNRGRGQYVQSSPFQFGSPAPAPPMGYFTSHAQGQSSAAPAPPPPMGYFSSQAPFQSNHGRGRGGLDPRAPSFQPPPRGGCSTPHNPNDKENSQERTARRPEDKQPVNYIVVPVDKRAITRHRALCKSDLRCPGCAGPSHDKSVCPNYEHRCRIGVSVTYHRDEEDVRCRIPTCGRRHGKTKCPRWHRAHEEMKVVVSCWVHERCW
ncbi:hypothetical protein BDV96DRAFT_565670 [Lophiotrema nucula]|uniref:Uncharacterized protein n=1 Tax=Lophiotrema nucula TaxID=690887 RepID=A0A6A5ZN50_9PLEO|nr:hypothetical protein BDV96DRAFT_565670 [Lophiotrema nucula]